MPAKTERKLSLLRNTTIATSMILRIIMTNSRNHLRPSNMECKEQKEFKKIKRGREDTRSCYILRTGNGSAA